LQPDTNSENQSGSWFSNNIHCKDKK
jgi:hypothetical protein